MVGDALGSIAACVMLTQDGLRIASGMERMKPAHAESFIARVTFLREWSHTTRFRLLVMPGMEDSASTPADWVLLELIYVYLRRRAKRISRCAYLRQRVRYIGDLGKGQAGEFVAVRLGAVCARGGVGRLA